MELSNQIPGNVPSGVGGGTRERQGMESFEEFVEYVINALVDSAWDSDLLIVGPFHVPPDLTRYLQYNNPQGKITRIVDQRLRSNSKWRHTRSGTATPFFLLSPLGSSILKPYLDPSFSQINSES